MRTEPNETEEAFANRLHALCQSLDDDKADAAIALFSEGMRAMTMVLDILAHRLGSVAAITPFVVLASDMIKYANATAVADAERDGASLQ